MFEVFELIINTLFSPQVLLLAVVIYVLRWHPDIVKRISKMKIFGAEFELQKIEKSLDEAVTKISNLESKLDSLKVDYISNTASKYDPIAPAKDRHKVGTELKAIAAALDDIDFVENYLNLSADPEEVYAAGCAIQVRPQPKFLAPLLSYIKALTKSANLGGLQLLIAFKLLQCVENIITTDSRRSEHMFSTQKIEEAISVLDAFAKHPICAADTPVGKDGVPSKVKKLCKKFEKQIADRQKSHNATMPTTMPAVDMAE